jgi:transcriptional regulator with GAF, ATPase, and Fis domain
MDNLQSLDLDLQMKKMRLKRLLAKRKNAAAILNDLAKMNNLTLSIEDVEGQVLLDVAGDDTVTKHPILFEGTLLGWVIGPEQAGPLTNLITHLAEKEAEKEILADGTLEHYRELNLLYNLSEKLATSLEVAAVAQTALGEASRLIAATGGGIMLLGEGQAQLESIITFGTGVEPLTKLTLGEGIIGAVAKNGRAEIVNEVGSDVRHKGGQGLIEVNSLVCAPLKAKDKVIGIIALVSETAVTYTAKDLKLLNTLATQATPAIENALLYEKTLREAKEREERLQQQIQELRIELDEARQDKQVAEITESDYFQQLRSEADDLRKIIQRP